MGTPAAWKAAAHPEWLQLLAATESNNHIPTDLLARIAYQECSWRPSVIFGTVVSPAGALGMMQLEPKYFSGCGQWQQDVPRAWAYLGLELHDRFDDWQMAVAAYNWGPTALSQWKKEGSLIARLPAETANYVRHVFADVPVAGALT